MMRRSYGWPIYDEFDDIRRQMGKLMNYVSSSSPRHALSDAEEGQEIVPLFREGGHDGFRVDVTQGDHEVIVTADMAPGVEKENVSMELVSPKALHITCERKVEREEKGGEEGNEGRYYLRERRYGSISRVIPLPLAVTPDRKSTRLNSSHL